MKRWCQNKKKKKNTAQSVDDELSGYFWFARAPSRYSYEKDCPARIETTARVLYTLVAPFVRDVQRVKMNIVRRRSVTDTSKRRRNNAASAGRTFLVNVYFNWVWDLFVNLRVDHNIPSSVERLEQHGLNLLSTDIFCWMIDEERERGAK